jgi:hypothetical protein
LKTLQNNAYIGWKDRFAQSTFTARQRDIAARNQLASIYTPQLVRNGHDWHGTQALGAPQATAQAGIQLQRMGDGNAFEARVEPLDAKRAWTAYWTVTEDGHSSRVQAGENAGEFLKHDFVVRQYTPLGRYQGPQRLQFFALAGEPEHARHINLVVSDNQSGEPLQALSLSCL